MTGAGKSLSALPAPQRRWNSGARSRSAKAWSRLSARETAWRVCTEASGPSEASRSSIGSVRVVVRAKNVVTLNELARGPRFAGQVVRWLLGKPSILAVVPSHVHVFWKTDDALELDTTAQSLRQP